MWLYSQYWKQEWSISYLCLCHVICRECRVQEADQWMYACILETNQILSIKYYKLERYSSSSWFNIVSSWICPMPIVCSQGTLLKVDLHHASAVIFSVWKIRSSAFDSSNQAKEKLGLDLIISFTCYVEKLTLNTPRHNMTYKSRRKWTCQICNSFDFSGIVFGERLNYCGMWMSPDAVYFLL